MSNENEDATIPTQDEIDAVQRNDLVAFIAKTFGILNPGREFKRNWHHSVIAHHLKEVMEGRCQRLIINMPPRYLKSIQASVAFPAYVLAHNPTKRIICASYAQDLAAKLSRDCRAIMESLWYKRLFPHTRLDAGHNTECDFATTRRGSRFATSVGGVLTGLGGDVVIIDDPIKPADAMSERAREGAIEWFNSTVSTRLDDKNTGAIIVIMQRLHLDDLTGHLLRAGGWTLVSIPAIATEPQSYAYGPKLVYRRSAGEVLQPGLQSEESLKRQKRMMGGSAFEAQYQQNPVPVEGAQIKREWFHYYDRSPNRVVGGPLYQSWDTASSPGELSDYSVGTTWYVDEGRYYLLDVNRVRLTYPELRHEIARYAYAYGCRRILIEEKGAGQHLIQEFRSRGYPRVIAFMPKGDKVMRLAAVSPVIEAGAVLFPQSADWLDDFETELLQFPNGRHDDQVDSVSQFLNYMEDQKTPDLAIYNFDGRRLY